MTRSTVKDWAARVRRAGNCVHPYEPTEPSGYREWHAWVEKYSKTHDQDLCPDCGLWAIWTPKVIRVDGGAECPACHRPYREHPWDEAELSGIDGQPYLRIGCDGQRLKL